MCSKESDSRRSVSVSAAWKLSLSFLNSSVFPWTLPLSSLMEKDEGQKGQPMIDTTIWIDTCS